MINLSLSPLKMVQYNAALVNIGAIEGILRDRIYRELGLESLAEPRFFSSIKEFIKQDKQIKRILDNSLQEQKYLSHPFFLVMLKSGIILVRSFIKLNQQFKINLKRKFLV